MKNANIAQGTENPFKGGTTYKAGYYWKKIKKTEYFIWFYFKWFDSFKFINMLNVNVILFFYVKSWNKNCINSIRRFF